jgi:hypothetical protein
MKRIILIVFAALGALATALPSQAAGSLPYNPSLASCQNWQDGRPSIIVSPPDMVPLGDMALVNGNIIVNPPQTVAHRVTIAVFNGSGWSVYSRGPWRAVTVAGWATTSNLEWQNLSTGAWEYGGYRFPINAPGTYKVWVEYYWYSNRYFGSASTAGYLTQISGGANASCRFYPGEF